MSMHSLDLSVIGNANINALIDHRGSIVWSCFPRMDGDPIFCSLLRNRDDLGYWKIELDQMDPTKTQHGYIGSRPIVRTSLTDTEGNSIEIIDFAPRYSLFHRFYRPNTIVRCVRPTAGKPRISIRLHPTFAYGWGAPERTRGSNHIRYLLANQTLRLTTNISITYIMNEVKFFLEEPAYLVLMPDESLTISPGEYFADSFEKTTNYWDNWCASLNLPNDYQDEVMHASVVLKLCSWEETGGLISSMTTSIATSPEPRSGALRDQRYCFLRDSCYIVRTMANLNVTSMMDGFRKYLHNIKVNHPEAEQSVYGIGTENRLVDKTIHRLAGYRGLSAVGVGTPEYRRRAVDAPAQIILAFAKMFFDKRCAAVADADLVRELEAYGDECLEMYREANGSLSVLRRPHSPLLGAQNEAISYLPESTLMTSVQCWAACERLGRISLRNNTALERGRYWLNEAKKLKESIIKSLYDEDGKSFIMRMENGTVDSSMLLMWQYEFLPFDDEKMLGTLQRIEAALLVPDHGLKARPEDKTLDFAATFSWIKIQAQMGHVESAKALFEKTLALAKRNGTTLSEKWDPATGEMWGNFPCAVSMASLIDCALVLGFSWTSAA